MKSSRFTLLLALLFALPILLSVSAIAQVRHYPPTFPQHYAPLYHSWQAWPTSPWGYLAPQSLVVRVENGQPNQIPRVEHSLGAWDPCTSPQRLRRKRSYKQIVEEVENPFLKPIRDMRWEKIRAELDEDFCWECPHSCVGNPPSPIRDK